MLPANSHERPDRARSGGRGHLRKTASSRKWGTCSRFVRCGLKVELRAAAGETSVSKRAPANRVPRGCVQRGREKGQECKGDGGKAGRKNMEIHTISGRTYDQFVFLCPSLLSARATRAPATADERGRGLRVGLHRAVLRDGPAEGVSPPPLWDDPRGRVHPDGQPDPVRSLKSRRQGRAVQKVKKIQRKYTFSTFFVGTST